MSRDTLRVKYENLFSEYPDIVDTSTLREMLGGVSEGFVLRTIRNKSIASFRLMGKDYKIPKESILDYVVSDTYQTIKHKLIKQI